MRFVLSLAMFALAAISVCAGEEPIRNPLVKGLAYSADGKYLAAVSWFSGEAKDIGYTTVWEMPAGKLVFSLREPLGFPSAAFSPDGSRLALGSFTENALIVDTTAWKIERKLPGHGKAARGVAFSPDGKTLAASSADGFINFWDTAAWTMQKTIDNAHVGRVYSIAFSKDGKTLASAGEDKCAKLWDLQTGNERHAFQQKSLVRRILFSGDDRLVIYTSWDRTLSIRDRETGKELASYESGGSADDIAVTRDGAYLAFTASGAQIVRLNVQPADDAVLRELRRIMKGWDDDSMEIRDKTSKEIASLGIPVLGELRNIAKESPSPEVRLRVRLVQSVIRSPESLFKIAHPEGGLESVAFSPDGRTLATAGAQGIVRLWDVATGRETSLLRQYPAVSPAAGNVPRSEY